MYLPDKYFRKIFTSLHNNIWFCLGQQDFFMPKILFWSSNFRSSQKITSELSTILWETREYLCSYKRDFKYIYISDRTEKISAGEKETVCVQLSGDKWDGLPTCA